MKTKHFFQKLLITTGRMVPGLAFLLAAREAAANPTGLTVVSGSATAQTQGNQLSITTSHNAVLDWSSFNIAAGEQTIFHQPSSTSIVFNHITDQNPSAIFGSLQANGVVVLLNSSGFYFGPNSFVSAAGLVVSTANFAPPQNTGGAWVFNGPPPLASIVNYGQVKIGHGGDCFFIADKVENHGGIEAPGGSIAFAAGQTVTLSERPDGRGMSMSVLLPQGSVDNYGNVIADGGTIALNAKVVNQNGLLQADSVKDVNGVIELVASDALDLGSDSKILAAGDGSAGGSAGGDVKLKSGNVFRDAEGSTISTAGGIQGGNGGDVEVSAPDVQSLNSAMDASAKAGFKGGSFLLDPDNIVLGTSGNGTVPDGGTVDVSTPGTLNLNVNTAFANKNFSSILLQAAGDITLKANTTWNLGTSTGVDAGQVTLEAGGNIIFNNNAKITDSKSWSLSLMAGYDFANNVVAYGAGSIYLNGGDGLSGNGAIQLAKGNLDMLAGQDILIGSGYARTSAGGNVSAEALAGNIDTGTYAHGYVFNSAKTLGSTFYKVDAVNGTGGISTMAGGNVSIIAAGNITSFMPSGNDAGSIGGDAGSGAFGPQAGNVTVVAGGNVSGHFVEANGTGKIYAGVKLNADGYPVDADGNPVKSSGKDYVLNPTSGGSAGTGDGKLALSLIAGGWTVNAAEDINLQELRNPNGVFNRFTSGVNIPPTYHYFDYSAGAYLNLNGGHAVSLGDGSSSLPRDNSDGINVPFIYAPILNIVAGSGGVSFGGDGDPYNKLILFPSAQGSLSIVTTAHGSLNGSLPPNSDGSPAIFNLIVSDSGQTQYSDSSLDLFGLNDHAATPVHLNNPTPIYLNIDGNMNSLLLGAPEAAQITIGGNMVNSRFQGMNLHGSDTTSIHVTGDIKNRSEFTTIDGVDTAPNLAYLTQVYPANALAANLAKSLFYDTTTKKLTYQGVLTDQVLALLQNLQIQVYVNGIPQVNPDGSPVLQTVAVIDAATASKLQQQYASDGPIPSTLDSGYLLGGGGKFEITARNIDLGTTLGIQAQGVGSDTIAVADGDGNTTISYPLAKYFTKGADISIHADIDMDMFSTAVASLNGGNIYIDVGGNLNVGSPVFTPTSLTPRGVFSTGQGNVAVYAGSDINIVGSRVAVYDTRPAEPGIPLSGGSLTVVSRHGNVNVGNGGSGFALVNSYYVDPVSRAVTAHNDAIPGSGILQTSYNQTGNVLVEAMNGDVNIGAGGIKQVLFKGSQTEVDQDELATLFRLALEGQDQAALAYQNQINGIISGAAVPYVDVYAGYSLEKLDAGQNAMVDTYGNPLITAANRDQGTLVKNVDGKNIDASGAGIVGAGTANLKATGGIIGNIVSFGDVNLDANKNINVNVFGLGVVSVASASGSVSGTVIGVGGINASGSSIDASLESNGAISGGTSGNTGFAASATAGNVAAGVANDDNKTAKTTEDTTDEDLKKKKKTIALAQKVSRVTVLLPKKN